MVGSAGATGDAHGKFTRAANLADAPLHHFSRCEFEVGEGREEFLDSNPKFETRQVRPETTVDAETERCVAVDLAVDVDLVSIGELGLVAVRSRER